MREPTDRVAIHLRGETHELCGATTQLVAVDRARLSLMLAKCMAADANSSAVDVTTGSELVGSVGMTAGSVRVDKDHLRGLTSLQVSSAYRFQRYGSRLDAAPSCGLNGFGGAGLQRASLYSNVQEDR